MKKLRNHDKKDVSVHLLGLGIDPQRMIDSVIESIKAKIQIVSDCPCLETSSALRTDLITYRSLRRVIAAKKPKSPSVIRSAARDIGYWKDQAISGSIINVNIDNILNPLKDFFEEPQKFECVSTMECVERIEKLQKKVRSKLDEKWFSFKEFHELRNELFRRIFHFVKAVRLTTKFGENLQKISDEFFELNRKMQDVNQTLGFLNDCLVTFDDREHSLAEIKWMKEKINISDEVRQKCVLALDSLEFTIE